MRTYIPIILLLFAVTFFLFFKKEVDFYWLEGTSNGLFLGDRIYVDKSVSEYDIGDFIVFYKNGKYIVHPIINIYKIDGKIIGYETRGLKNSFSDPPVFPDEVIGRAFKILEDGSVEEDTKAF